MTNAVSASRLADFRTRLPHLSDLHERFASNSTENFFRTFPRWFDESETTLQFYQQIERDLSFVPDSEWASYATKIGEVVNLRDRKGYRDWEKLFDVFNEAIGARVLVEKFTCDVVQLMAASQESKSCDWFGSAAGKRHLLEVKTLNHSDDERKSWFKKCTLLHTCCVPEPLIAKARGSYANAKAQLDAMPDAANAHKVVLFVINADYNFHPLDNSVGELLLREFEAFEDPNYFIQLAVNSPNA